MSEKCAKCNAKLIPVGYAPQMHKTTNRLYWVEQMQKCFCQTCMIEGFMLSIHLLDSLSEMRYQFKTLVDDIVNFPGEFDKSTESVVEAIEYLELH